MDTDRLLTWILLKYPGTAVKSYVAAEPDVVHAYWCSNRLELYGQGPTLGEALDDLAKEVDRVFGRDV
jgi:hypothetical protein